MDNKILLIFGCFLAVFLLFPIVAKQLRDNGNSASAAAQGSNAQAAESVPQQPPFWNSQNIVGTRWRADWEGNMVDFIIAPNGLLYASHPLIKAVTGQDRVEGTWRVEYDRAYVYVRLGDKEYKHTIKIIGDAMYRGQDKLEQVH